MAGRQRTWLWEAGVVPIASCWVAAIKRDWSFQARGAIMTVSFLVITHVTYRVSAFQGSGAVLGAFTVVASGLLFGRRVILLVLVLTVAAPIASAVFTLVGGYPAPSAELVSPEQLAPWVRTTFVAFTIWTLLGVAVTYVVAHIERTVETEREATLDLRAEKVRRELAEAERHEAERAALQAQKLEVVGSLAGGVAHDFNVPTCLVEIRR